MDWSYRSHKASFVGTQYQKMMITKEIYESLNKDNCRFLKYNSDGFWEELSPMAARDKVGDRKSYYWSTFCFDIFHCPHHNAPSFTYYI